MRDKKKQCGHEFSLRYGYYCELSKGHYGDHETECPNPQFHQSWPQDKLEEVPLPGIKCWRECRGITNESGRCPICGTISTTINTNRNNKL